MENANSQKLVFGLDIGTRSVVGTVGYKEKDRFVVVCQRSLEHDTRAMLDGQIHDIARVADTVKEVKEACEAAAGVKLTSVCIAAAGRVLKTLNTHADMVFTQERPVSSEDVSNLMSLGVEKAYSEFKNDGKTKYLCVGYSVIKYYINDLVISNPVGHKTEKMSADLIATFLPEDVVDGLYQAVELAGLEVANLTLEPIAAISVAIPEKFRMLNIALVDVGAGTSDVCITKEGSIVAYGMIPEAGDALTDMISLHCLVDFDMAEKIKRDSDNNDVIEYEDIMGLKQTITREEILTLLDGKIKEEAEKIGDEILRLNNDKPVSAVFVVGGGGIVTGFTEALSGKLGIAKERVALRGSEVMGAIDYLEDTVKTSLLVTPVGICLNYYEHSNNIIYVTFNGKRMKMYDNGKVTVADVAYAAGFPNDGLFPKRGKPLTYSVNGKSRIQKGELGEAGTILVNDKAGVLNQHIEANDKIVITESTAGVRARIRIENLPEYKAKNVVKVDGVDVVLSCSVKVNGKSAEPDYEIKEDDRIEIGECVSSDVIFEAINSGDAGNTRKAAPNSEESSNEYSGFIEDSKDKSISESNSAAEEVVTNVNDVDRGKSVESSEYVHNNSEKKDKITVFVNDKPVELYGKKEYVFVDVFDYIDFDLSKPEGKGIVTRHNGSNAGYMDSVNSGDRLEIYWTND